MSHETHSPSTGFNGADRFINEKRSSIDWEVSNQEIPDHPPHEMDKNKPNWWLKMRKKLAAGAITLSALVGVGGIAYNQFSDDAEATPNEHETVESVEAETSEESGVVEDPLTSKTYENYPFTKFGDQPYESFEQQAAEWQLTNEDQIAQDLTGAINQIANYTPSDEEYENMGLHELALSNPYAEVSSMNDAWIEDGVGTFGEEYLAPHVTNTFMTEFPGTSETYPEGVDISIPITQFIVDTQTRKFRDPSYEGQIEVLYSEKLSGLQSMGVVGIGTEMWIKFTDNDPNTEDTHQIWRTSTIEEGGALKVCDSSFQVESKEQLQIYADQQNIEINL